MPTAAQRCDQRTQTGRKITIRITRLVRATQSGFSAHRIPIGICLHVVRYFLFDTPTFYLIVFGLHFMDFRDLQGLIDCQSRLIAFDLQGVSGREGKWKEDLLRGNSPMVGSKPTGCNTMMLFYKEAGKVRTKYFRTASRQSLMRDAHCDGGWVLAAILYHIA
jgi:hypothetical protein